MSGREFREWAAFDQLEPIGEIRADYRTGMLCALVANMMKKRGQTAAKPLDFMPFHPSKHRAPARRAQTPDEMTAALVRMTQQLGGSVKYGNS